MQNEYTVGSLFSGIGGIEIGFESEGFKTEWFIEKEPYAQAILKKRFPGTIIYEDITKIDFKTIPKVDILTGGFPCQDISDAGKRVGIGGSRSSLWKYYFKAIRILRPKIAFIENVSALAIRGLNVVLSDLAKIGYDAEWYNLSASAVGAFHQRERIFIIAYPNSNWKSDESINKGQRQGIVGKISNASSIRCDNGCNNREERQVQNSKERSIEKDKSEGDGWKHRSSEVCEVVSNSNNQRKQRGREVKMGFEKLSTNDVENSKCIRIDEGGGEENYRGEEKIKYSNNSQFTNQGDRGWWSAEPKLGRVADGIPNRVDRIKCLGNAVVPQCAEVFAKAIKMKLDTQTHGLSNKGGKNASMQ